MKKQGMKKGLALIMSAAMAWGVTACGSSSKGTGASGNSGEGEESRETITFMAVDFNAGTSNTGDYAEQILDTVEDYCDADLDIDWVLSDVMEERTTLAMANPQTMPMVMTWSGTLTGNVVSAAKQGAFVDVGQYIWDEEKYPNLSQMNQNIADALTVDGKLIAIPRTRDIGRYGMSYRQDWADKLGIDEPQTIDDVYDMLYKFTYEDPDGNGVDDTYGMEMTQYIKVFDIIQTWFGVGNGWAEQDGKLVPVHMQPEYKEALDWIKKVYDDGLMPPDWAVRTTDTWGNGVKTGESGVHIDTMDGGRRIWDYFVAEESYTPSVVNPDEPASMNLLGPVNGKTLATDGYNGYFTLSASTCDTPEKIEAALRVLDRVNDNDIRILMEYGLEGINWEKNENGELVDLDVENPTLAANYMGLNQLLPYIPRYTPTPAPATNERRAAQDEAYLVNAEVAVFNPALSYLANSPTQSDVGKSLADILQQARTQYICGEIDESGLQAAWDRWLNEGGQQIIDEVNEQYAANQ